MQMSEEQMVKIKITTIKKGIVAQMRVITFGEYNLTTMQDWIYESVMLGWCYYQGNQYIIRKRFDEYRLDPCTYPVDEELRQIYLS